MQSKHLRSDVLAGLTSSFALVPECIAFALVAHLNPLMGLYGAFIICTLTALFGGRPGMVSGAAGSMAVVIVALVVEHGVHYLLATVLLGGLLMITPILFMFSTSLKTSGQIYDLRLIPQNPTFSNYIKVLTGGEFLRWFLNSSFVAICVTTSNCFFDSLVGYTLAKFSFRW